MFSMLTKITVNIYHEVTLLPAPLSKQHVFRGEVRRAALPDVGERGGMSLYGKIG